VDVDAKSLRVLWFTRHVRQREAYRWNAGGLGGEGGRGKAKKEGFSIKAKRKEKATTTHLSKMLFHNLGAVIDSENNIGNTSFS
jgi:hypothetical protein